ncbi:MAG: nitroreductase family protein [Lachnoclostridium sp.]|nr:nitroreductase family protein [Lachnoclostridium sp.]
MKTSLIINLFLAAALVVVSYKLVNDRHAEEQPVISSSALENIMTRTSVRDYTDQPVEEAKIETMLRAAMAAPTAGNKQPWRFVVIDDKTTLSRISEMFPSMKMAAKAPLAIVVCGDTTATFKGEGVDYWIQDGSAATENLLLAAHEQGLGAVWCGIYPISERVATLTELLQLPDSILPLNVIPIGYPAESPQPKDKWKPENIHHNIW